MLKLATLQRRIFAGPVFVVAVYMALAQRGRHQPQPRPGDGADSRVITVNVNFSEMPDAVWLKCLLPNATVVHHSTSAGAALLPRRRFAVLSRSLGDVTPNIVAVDLAEPPPGRDTFVGYHRDLRRFARMRELLSLIVEKLAN